MMTSEQILDRHRCLRSGAERAENALGELLGTLGTMLSAMRSTVSNTLAKRSHGPCCEDAPLWQEEELRWTLLEGTIQVLGIDEDAMVEFLVGQRRTTMPLIRIQHSHGDISAGIRDHGVLPRPQQGWASTRTIAMEERTRMGQRRLRRSLEDLARFEADVMARVHHLQLVAHASLPSRMLDGPLQEHLLFATMALEDLALHGIDEQGVHLGLVAHPDRDLLLRWREWDICDLGFAEMLRDSMATALILLRLWHDYDRDINRLLRQRDAIDAQLRSLRTRQRVFRLGRR